MGEAAAVSIGIRSSETVALLHSLEQALVYATAWRAAEKLAFVRLDAASNAAANGAEQLEADVAVAEADSSSKKMQAALSTATQRASSALPPDSRLAHLLILALEEVDRAAGLSEDMQAELAAAAREIADA